MIFVRYPFPCDLKVLDFGTSSVNAYQIEDDIGSYLGCNQFSLFYNGRKIHDAEIIPDNSTVHVTFPLPGGKGGFGSMLRAIGAQIEKTTNREACRDLSGRRLRDINEEQRLKKWIAKEAEREAEKVRRRQARIERLKTKAPHKFFDFEYEKKISELPERIDEALSEGLQKVKQAKRPHENPEEKKLPKKSWAIDDFPISSSDSDSDETTAATEGSLSKKMKISPKESLGCDSDVSESSLTYPSTSKDSTFIPEDNTSSNFSMEEKTEESSTDSDKMDVVQNREGVNKELSTVSDLESTKCTDIEENKTESTEVSAADSNSKDKVTPELSNSTAVKEPETEVTEVDHDAEKKAEPELSNNVVGKKTETKDVTPIDLQDFQSVSELEELGLDKLKSALMVRGLKCGGTLSDRAQRLWTVRGLQPHQYPKNLLAKNKK